MIPDDLQDVRNVALDLEAQAHKNGWDAPPVVGVFYDVGIGYRTASIPVDIAEVHPETRVALKALAESMRATREIRAPLNDQFTPEVRSQLAGIWLIHEAWVSDIAPEERGGRSLADIPGSWESRGVVVIDCGGRVVYVRRTRGEDPVVEGEDVAVTGAMVEALADLLMEHCLSMPDDAYDRKAIEALMGEP